MWVIIMRASKTKLNKKKLVENYVAYLIKESDKRVLNERELLTLIAYTEGIRGEKFGTWVGKKLAPRIFKAPSVPKAPTALTSDQLKTQMRANKPTKNPGESGSEYKERLRREYYPQKEKAAAEANQKSADAYNTSLANYEDKLQQVNQRRQNFVQRMGDIGDQIGDLPIGVAAWTGANIVSPAAAYVSKQAGNAWNATKRAATNPENWRKVGRGIKTGWGLARSGVSAVKRAIDANAEKARIWADDLKRRTGVSMNPDRPLFGGDYYPGIASESTIIKNGKRIKQKPVLTDLQEQMLIDYLKYKNKKRKK